MAEDVQNMQVVGGGVQMQACDPSQMQPVQFNVMQQPQMMQGAGVGVNQVQMNQGGGQVTMQQLSPVGMAGGQMAGIQMVQGQLSPSQMVGGQMVGGQMVGGQMVGGQMVGGQMVGGQMAGGQMVGGQMVLDPVVGGQMASSQMVGGQMVAGQMTGVQMAGGQVAGGQMAGGQVAGGQMAGGQMAGGQMVGGQMAGGQMRGFQMVVSPTGQMAVDPGDASQVVTNQMSVQGSGTAEISVCGMVPDQAVTNVGSGEMTAVGVVTGDSGGVQIMSSGITSQGTSDMVSVGMVGEVGGVNEVNVVSRSMVNEASMVSQSAISEANMVTQSMVGEVSVNGEATMVSETSMASQSTTNEASVVTQSMVGEVNVCGEATIVSEASMAESSVTSSTIETSRMIQTEQVSMVECQTAIQDQGYSMEILGTVDAQPEQVDAGCTMEVIGTVDPVVSEEPSFNVETLALTDQECMSRVSQTSEIRELNEKLDLIKNDFEKERDEIETKYMAQMKRNEMRSQQEKDEMRIEAKKKEDEYEEKLKNERTKLNEVQLKLTMLQAEMDSAEKSSKRQDDEIDELEAKLKKVKNERDQLEEINRRLKMELQRVQQQSYADKNTIKQLQTKLAQVSGVEKEVHTKLVREMEKTAEYVEKITVIENTVTTLEKQNRDYVTEIEILNEKLRKERKECDELRMMLSEENKDDEKYGQLIRELQRKVKELSNASEELDQKWMTEKQQVAELNTQVFQLATEKTKFQKLAKNYKEDVEEISGKYTREKSEVERLEEELSRLRREQAGSNNIGDLENVISDLEEKIRRLTFDCESFEEKYKYEKREKTDYEDKFQRMKSEMADLQEKYRRVDIEKDSYSRKCREMSETYQQKIRSLQEQLSELRQRPSGPIQTTLQPLAVPVPQPAVVTYLSAPSYVDTMTELGISIEKYNEMKHQKDSIEQRYNALVELLAKYEDEVQTLEKENKEIRLSVTDVDFTSISISKQETNMSGHYSDVEYRRLLDDKDYFEGKYKKEKAERENAEKKVRDLRNYKENLEDKLNDVAKVITRYEQDARVFRNENDQLRRQLQVLLVNGNFQKNVSVEYNVRDQGRRDSDKSLDRYKHEIDELHRENEEFKQLLDSLDSKDGGKDGGDKDNRGRVSALESEVSSLQTVIVELEKTIAYQNKAAEDGKMQLEDEKWRLREHVQRLEDKVKEQVRMIDEYDRKMVELRGKFTDEVSGLGEKLLNEVERNMQLEEHIKHLQKHLADLDRERKEILTRFDVFTNNETEFVRDMEELEERYRVDITELQDRLKMEMNDKGNLTRDIQHLLDELDSLRTRETAIETQFIRERDEIKGQYEFEKIDILRQYHEENTRIKVQLDEEKKKRKQLEDEIAILRRGASTHTVSSGDSGLVGGRGDVNVVLGDDQRRREYLEEENKKLLYQMNLLLSKKDGSEDRNSGLLDSSDDITRIKRKLALVEEERDKLERMKKDLEYELDRNKSKFDNLQAEIERYREFERKYRELTDELRTVKSMNDELNRKQRDLISDNDNLNRTMQDMERDNRKLTMEIDHLTMQLKKLQSSSGGGAGVHREDTTVIHSSGNNEEIMKMRYEFESKLKDQLNANRQLEKTLRDLQREMEGMHDTKSLMQSNFNQQKELLLQQVAAGSVRGDAERDSQRQTDEWRRLIDESERRFKDELNRIETQKREQYDNLKREKDAMAESYRREKDDMRRKIFDIEEQLRRKDSSWQSSTPAPVHHMSYPAPSTHGSDDIQRMLREKDSYIEQLKSEKFEVERNFEREKNRLVMDVDMERNKAKKTIDDLEDTVRSLRKQKIEFEEKIRDLELKHAREKDRLEHDFVEEKRQLQKILDRNLESVREDVKRECENKYFKIINDLEREKERLLERLEREKADVLSYGNQIGQSRSTYLESNTTIVTSKYESEIRHLQKQLKDQTQSIELEKQELTRRFEQEKKTIEARLIHEKKVLEISVQAMTREIAKLKHERNEIRKNYKAEIDKLRLQIERGRIDTRSDTNSTREIHSSHTSSTSHVSQVVSYEERRSFERNVDELKEKIRDYETTVQKLERNHAEEIRFMVKNFENEKGDLENAWLLEKERLQANVEAEFEEKLTDEKRKFENTMTALRREVNCLQDQRRLLQMKITSNSVFVGDRDAFEKSMNDYKRDVLEKLQREYAERIERERRPLEDTIKELRRDVENVRRERNEARANFRQEKLKLQEEFDRERERLMQEKNDIKNAAIGGGFGGKFKPGDDDRVSGEDDPLGQVEKSYQESSLKRLEKENNELKDENSRKDNELLTLTAKLENLEIRYKQLAMAPNKKGKPRRGFGVGSPCRPSVLDGLVPSDGSQPIEAERSPDRRSLGAASPSGQCYGRGSSPLLGGRSPDGLYPVAPGNRSSSPTEGPYLQRDRPYDTLPPDRTSVLPSGSGLRSSPTRGNYRQGGSPTGGKYPQGGTGYGSYPSDRNSAGPSQAGRPRSSGPGASLLSSPAGGMHPQRGSPYGSTLSTRSPFLSGQPGGVASGSFPPSSISDFSSGSYRSIRPTFEQNRNTSPTRRSPSALSSSIIMTSKETVTGNINMTSVNRGTSLHHRSLSADFLSGRGTKVSFGGRPRDLTSLGSAGLSRRLGLSNSLQNRFSSSSFSANRYVSGSYHTDGGYQGYRGGAGRYLGGGQFIGVGQDEFIDDSGLGMDDVGRHGNQENEVPRPDSVSVNQSQGEVRQAQNTDPAMCSYPSHDATVKVEQKLEVKEATATSPCSEGKKDSSSSSSSRSSSDSDNEE